MWVDIVNIKHLQDAIIFLGNNIKALHNNKDKLLGIINISSITD